MPTLPRAGVVPLSAGPTQLLDDLLEREALRVRAFLGRRSFGAPACALAFVYVWDEDLPVVTEAFVLTEPFRAEVMERFGAQGLWRLWCPPDWDQEDFLGDPGEDAYAAAERLAAAMTAAGCPDPEGAFLSELAFRLSRMDWSAIMPTTDDFACWAMEHELTEEVFETFRAVASEAAVEAYEARDWLRFPEELLGTP